MSGFLLMSECLLSSLDSAVTDPERDLTDSLDIFDITKEFIQTNEKWFTISVT